jgi:hypothetical protein
MPDGGRISCAYRVLIEDGIAAFDEIHLHDVMRALAELLLTCGTLLQRQGLDRCGQGYRITDSRIVRAISRCDSVRRREG